MEPMATRALVRDPDHIRLAMLGMVDGNGHPYSWSAIINGRYDAHAMGGCGYPSILNYLEAQPPEALGVEGVQVTHIWCDRAEDAQRVARAAYIQQVVDKAVDVIGEVDAVIISTDVGSEHLDRARPFIEAGLPVFIDKPLTDVVEHLCIFADWWCRGLPILSTSCMRYAHEFQALRSRLESIGDPKLILATMAKSWERYGIHAVDSVYGLLPPGGWADVVNSGTSDRNIVHIRHEMGVDVVLAVANQLTSGFGHVHVLGTVGTDEARFTDTFSAFKAQLCAFVQMLRTGRNPVPPEQTLEQIRIIIAGIRSRDQGGRRVNLKEIPL